MGPIQRDSDPLVTTPLESGSPRKGQRGAIYQPSEQRVTAEYQPCTSVFVPVFKRGYPQYQRVIRTYSSHLPFSLQHRHVPPWTLCHLDTLKVVFWDASSNFGTSADR